MGPCDDSANVCEEGRITRLSESRDQAREFCGRRPLSIDSRFVGPCPKYMEELESEKYAGDEWILPRVMLRSRFKSRDEDGAILESSFKRTDSIQSIRELLIDDPNNPFALVRLLILLDESDVVEKLNVNLKLHESDSDCPNDWSFRRRAIHDRVSTLTDNWLAEHGPGSEMPKKERSKLLRRVQHTLLSLYDTGVAQDHMTNRLYWALESIHDPILSGNDKDLERIATSFSTYKKDPAVERRTELVNNLTQTYDIESVHGRAETLVMMCNDYAFELGLTEHCYKIITHYGQKDTVSLETPGTDWLRAAILLVNALTRDCSSHVDVNYYMPVWQNLRQCQGEHIAEYTTQIKELLKRYPQSDRRAERALLEAYLHLEDSGDERFVHALELDEGMIEYAAILIKRLHRQGKIQAAFNILKNIDDRHKDLLNWYDLAFLNKISNSLHDREYSNWREFPRRVFLEDEAGDMLR